MKAKGIPHARGDGPHTYIRRSLKIEYSPRTWGWTGAHKRMRTQEIVFPTHVGMDRCALRFHHNSLRIPHARGDGPGPCPVTLAGVAYSPRTWGWTVGGAPGGLLYLVFPTLVGMDR